MDHRDAIDMIRLAGNAAGVLWAQFDLPFPYFRVSGGLFWGPWWGVN